MKMYTLRPDTVTHTVATSILLFQVPPERAGAMDEYRYDLPHAQGREEYREEYRDE